MPDWIKAIAFIAQKGFGVASGLVGLKLLLVDAKLSTPDGLAVATIGAVLLGVAAVIEYLVWRETTHVLDKRATKQLEELGKHLAEGRTLMFKQE